MNKKLLIAIIVTSILTFLALDDIIVDWSQIDGSFGKLYIFFTQDLFPPDWSILSNKGKLIVNLAEPFPEIDVESTVETK